MSQKIPPNRDRVSPRRRFHRPAAEFLGARRQVPVLTGLPSIERPSEIRTAPDDTVHAIDDDIDIETPNAVESVQDAAQTAPDLVQPEVDIREVSRTPEPPKEPWRDWAYPIAGTLIASLLVYMAWVGLNRAPAKQGIEKQVESFVSMPSTAMAESAVVARTVTANPTATNAPFVSAPIVFQEPKQPKSGPEFVEHDALHWEAGTPSIATKPDLQTTPDAFDTTDSSDNIPFVAAEPLEAPSESFISTESFEDDYPTTEYSDELPLPQAGVENPDELSSDFAVAPNTNSVPGLNAATGIEANVPLLPTGQNQFAGFDPQPSLAISAHSHSAHQYPNNVVVNPHFKPRNTPESAGPVFETAQAMPAARNSFAPTNTAQQPDATVQQSMYGSFPNSSGTSQPAQPSVDQARLNGNIEPFPNVKR